MSKVIKTDVCFQINGLFFWNYRNKEIDFIIKNESNNKIDGIEVKYRNRLDLNNIKTLFSKNIKLNKRYIITKENSIINYTTKEVTQIKYYTLWKYKKKLL
jgi:hypothetical protein